MCLGVVTLVLGITLLALLETRTVGAQSSGLVGEWRFEDGAGAVAADTSGSANHGTLINGPVWTAGKLGNGLLFDGVNDYVDLGNSPSLNPSTAISISAWIRTSTTSVSQYIVGKDNLPLPGQLQYFLRVQGSAVRFAVRTNSEAYLTTGSVLTPNVWYHVVGVYDGADMRIYVNGALVGLPLPKTGTMSNNGANVRIGTKQGLNLPFKGTLDEVRIYDRALSATEVFAMYQGGTQPPMDAQPPAVSITSPAAGQLVAGNISVTANASDNVGVAGVLFKLDGANLGAEDTVSPYVVSWNSTQTAGGSHNLTAVARDAAGNTTTSAQVIVTVDNSPPTIPAGLTATVVSSSQIDLNWNASTDNTGVTGYRVFRNGIFIASTSAPAFSDSGLSPSTSYTYTVSACDAPGNQSAQSSPVSATTAAPADTSPPTVSLTSPTQSQIVSGSVTIVASASDDVGVVSLQFLVDGINFGQELTAPPYIVSWDTMQVANSSHTVTAVARDAAGNSTTATEVTVMVDNAPPTVPAGVSATVVSASQINLTWNASSDNQAVAGYRIYRDTVQVGSSISPAYSDMGLSPSTTFTYTVSAYDAVGNASAQSAPVTATTLPPSFAGPVAEFHFEEGAGIVTADTSGSGNHGTLINGPVWTSGKLGNGLLFDGVNDYVDLGNSPSLNPSTAISISAWIRTSTTSVSQYIVGKDNLPIPGQLQYFLRVQGSAVRFAVRTSSEAYLTTGSVLTPNVWYHVAGVYDGTNMRIYVNGALVGLPLPKTGTMSNNGASALIGTKQSLNLPFKGAIDEVRIFGRALSAAEVDAVYRDRIDFTPPAVAIVSPQDNSPASGMIAVQATASDDVAVAHVELYVDGKLFNRDATSPYDLMLSTSLLPAGAHTLTARAFDTAGNQTDSLPVTILVDNQATATRPNIIFIVTDDVRFDAMQYAPLTTALLKNESVIFNNAFVAESVCCPSRSSILTGLYSHNHGVLENSPPHGGAQYFNDSSTIATWLHQAGYFTGLFGKYLNDYEDILPHFIPPGWDDWHAQLIPTTLDYNYNLFENGVVVNYGTAPQDYGTDVIAARAIEFIETAPAAQPLFIYFATNNYIPGPTDVSTFSWLPLWRPPSYNETDVTDKPTWLQKLPLISPTREAASDDYHEMQLECLQSTDRAVAGIVDALRRTNRFDNSVIIFTSDNGIAWGEHRIVNNKFCVYEECIKVPLWIRVPGIPGRVDDRITVNVDFAPTFAEWAGAIPASKVDGFSLVSLLRDTQSPWPAERLTEYLGVTDVNGIPEKRYHAIRTSNFIYIEYDNGDRELYDLVADPYQLNNVINDPAYASVVNTLKSVLAVQKNL